MNNVRITEIHTHTHTQPGTGNTYTIIHFAYKDVVCKKKFFGFSKRMAIGERRCLLPNGVVMSS